MTGAPANTHNRKLHLELIEPAVSYTFITARQEKVMRLKLFAHSFQDNTSSAARFFATQRTISKEKIDLIYAVNHYVEVLMADKEFGRLGAINQFVSPQYV